MHGVCPEYEQRLRAYERAFNAWTGRGAEPDGVVDACLGEIEMNYQALVDHQQSCLACLTSLGKVRLQNVDRRAWRAS
jgi:hypothetical protein